MAEHSSVNPSASDCEQVDLSSDREILGSNFLIGQDTHLHQSYMKFGLQRTPFAKDNINPNFYEFTRKNEYGLIEIDIEKLERKVWSLNLNEGCEDDPSQKESNVQSLREKVFEYFETIEKDESSAKQTEPEKDSSSGKQNTENLTDFKYERKDKPWDRKPHLRQLGREFTEDLEKLKYKKHFSSEFPSGELVEDEPIEDISVSVDHIEFKHKKLPLNFLEMFEKEDFPHVASDLENDPQINNIVPSFIEFLKGDNRHKFAKNCFTLILAILKNPYRKLEVFFDDKLPVVKEQIDIAEYLLNCLHVLKILDDKEAFEKFAEAIIRFNNKHHSFHAHILEVFNALLSELLSEKIDYKVTYQICSKVLNLMISIGASAIDRCLPKHFEKISCLPANDRNCDLYFHLLRSCEISIANTIETDDVDLGLFSDDVDLVSFYTNCYNYFGRDLTVRLIPVFKKHEKRKDREEQYLSNKHAIFPTKYGYMCTEIRFLTNRNKIRARIESSCFPEKECTFDSATFNYVIPDICELPVEDFNYCTSLNEFPVSWKVQPID